MSSSPSSSESFGQSSGQFLHAPAGAPAGASTGISAAAAHHPPLLLEAVAGPHPLRVELAAEETHTLGRGVGCAVLLDDPATLVSRRHAQLAQTGGEWSLTDLGSRHGTRLNGVAIGANQTVPVRSGDLVSIGPWTLMLGLPARAGMTVGESTHGTINRRVTDDDRGTTGRTIKSIQPGEDAALASDRLQLLLQVAEAIHRADTLTQLSESVIGVLAAGTRFGNIAMLRPMASDGSVEVLALRTSGRVRPEHYRFSRSILLQAATGVVVIRSAMDSPGEIEASMVTLEIAEALCVPLMAEGVVLALLYLDNRGDGRNDDGRASRRPARAGEDRAFATAVGRMAGLAMRNLMSREISVRLAAREGEVAAAAAMQGMILPAERGAFPGVDYAARYRAGRDVSGDFFDVIALDDGRVAVAVGDVSGKGVGAAVLAVLTQGYLRGALCASGDMRDALGALQTFIWAKTGAERFVTLWLGVIDPAAGRLRYVDAGHGYAMLVEPGGRHTVLTEDGGPPLGATDNTVYQFAERDLPADAVLLLMSDGVIEQPSAAAASGTAESLEHFGVEGMMGRIDVSMPPNGIVDAIFAAVAEHAGTLQLADDATVVAVRRTGP
ncbi:MAG: SpoIIE family protein phosphatase [Phycisphaerales bacterium]